MSKACYRCRMFKSISDFNIRKASRDGLDHLCRTCRAEDRKREYSRNRDKYISRSKKAYRSNPLKKAEYDREYREKNIEKLRAQATVYQKHRYSNDTLYRLRSALAASIRNRIYRIKAKKDFSTLYCLGCCPTKFLLYLESKFTDGMTWENYGQWHIDHIIPLSSANTKQEVIDLNHYTNLQPLWAIDNIKKSNKTGGYYQNKSRR